MAQPKRTETLERFRRGEIRLLVASDVAARGLDIKEMSHVFCFDVPHHAEDYVHRIGRTGRAGRSGRSFMLAAPEDGNAVAAIVRLIGKEIPGTAVDGMAPAELVYDERGRGRARRSPPADRAPRRDSAAAARPKRAAERRPQRAAVRPSRRDENGGKTLVDSAKQRRPERGAATDDRRTVGFGEHLPAFLARPPRVVASP
jgi:superfamily II DNA/RNA helicase